MKVPLAGPANLAEIASRKRTTTGGKQSDSDSLGVAAALRASRVERPCCAGPVQCSGVGYVNKTQRRPELHCSGSSSSSGHSAAAAQRDCCVAWLGESARGEHRASAGWRSRVASSRTAAASATAVRWLVFVTAKSSVQRSGRCRAINNHLYHAGKCERTLGCESAKASTHARALRFDSKTATACRASPPPTRATPIIIIIINYFSNAARPTTCLHTYTSRPSAWIRSIS